jgi:hypothetical protein
LIDVQPSKADAILSKTFAAVDNLDAEAIAVVGKEFALRSRGKRRLVGGHDTQSAARFLDDGNRMTPPSDAKLGFPSFGQHGAKIIASFRHDDLPSACSTSI